jgi:hypothetical protein
MLLNRHSSSHKSKRQEVQPLCFHNALVERHGALWRLAQNLGVPFDPDALVSMNEDALLRFQEAVDSAEQAVLEASAPVPGGPGSFDALPPELWAHIMTCLPVDERYIMTKVSRRLRMIANQATSPADVLVFNMRNYREDQDYSDTREQCSESRNKSKSQPSAFAVSLDQSFPFEPPLYASIRFAHCSLQLDSRNRAINMTPPADLITAMMLNTQVT